MTDACLRSLESTLPPHCTVTGYTTPHPTPSAIEGHLDGVLSAAAAIRAVVPIASKFDAFLVACFSAHPLINALREELSGPVIGIMEAALYSARMLGGRLGIVATGGRSKIMHEDAIRYYGLDGFSAGVETTNLGVLELETLPRDKVLGLVGEAARRLVQDKGADCIALGCAGMTEMKIRCEEAVGSRDATAQVIDGVGVGVQILIGLVREGHVTAKGGVFRSAQDGGKQEDRIGYSLPINTAKFPQLINWSRVARSRDLRIITAANTVGTLFLWKSIYITYLVRLYRNSGSSTPVCVVIGPY